MKTCGNCETWTELHRDMSLPKGRGPGFSCPCHCHEAKSKHTPGPWKVIDGAIIAKELNKFGNFIVVEMPSRSGHGVAQEESANARLIAAAPEMLELLRDIGQWLEVQLRHGKINAGTANRDGDLVSQIAAAIAKAEGKE